VSFRGTSRARAWAGLIGPATEVDAIERDVRAELEAHLEHAIVDRVESGLDPESARLEAHEVFGDYDGTVHACVRQKLGGRLMWAKIHVAVTAVLLVGLGLTIHRSYAMQEQLQLEAQEARAIAVEFAERKEPREIRLGVGDRITVISTYHQDLTQKTFVEQDGTALFPPAGRLHVHGLTRGQLEELLNESFAAFYTAPVEVYVRVEQD